MRAHVSGPRDAQIVLRLVGQDLDLVLAQRGIRYLDLLPGVADVVPTRTNESGVPVHVVPKQRCCHCKRHRPQRRHRRRRPCRPRRARRTRHAYPSPEPSASRIAGGAQGLPIARTPRAVSCRVRAIAREPPRPHTHSPPALDDRVAATAKTPANIRSRRDRRHLSSMNALEVAPRAEAGHVLVRVVAALRAEPEVMRRDIAPAATRALAAIAVALVDLRVPHAADATCR
jgi:hypothetical protein